MKKTNFLYASAITMAFAFGMTSCEQSQDNPVPQPDPEPVLRRHLFMTLKQHSMLVRIQATRMVVHPTVRYSMVGRKMMRPTASVRTTKVTNGLRVACCLKFAMYGVVATVSMVTSRMVVSIAQVTRRWLLMACWKVPLYRLPMILV